MELFFVVVLLFATLQYSALVGKQEALEREIGSDSDGGVKENVEGRVFLFVI